MRGERARMVAIKSVGKSQVNIIMMEKNAQVSKLILLDVSRDRIIGMKMLECAAGF